MPRAQPKGMSWAQRRRWRTIPVVLIRIAAAIRKPRSRPHQMESSKHCARKQKIFSIACWAWFRLINRIKRLSRPNNPSKCRLLGLSRASNKLSHRCRSIPRNQMQRKWSKGHYFSRIQTLWNNQTKNESNSNLKSNRDNSRTRQNLVSTSKSSSLSKVTTKSSINRPNQAISSSKILPKANSSSKSFCKVPC